MQVFSNSQEAYGALDEALRTAVRGDPGLAQDLNRLDDAHLAAVKQAWYAKHSEQVQIDTGRKRWQGGSTGMDADVPATNTVPVTRRLYAPEVERQWEALQSGERDLDALPQAYHADLTDIAQAHGRGDLVERPEQGSGFFKKRLATIASAAARLDASMLRGAIEIGSKVAQESVRTLPLGTATPRGARAEVQLRPEAISAFAKEIHTVAGQVYGEDPEYRNSLEGMLLEGAVQLVGQMATLGTGLVPQMYDEALQDAEASMGKPLHQMNDEERGRTEMMAGLYSVIGGALEYGPLKLITRKLQGPTKDVLKKLADPSIRRELLKGFAAEGLPEMAQGQVLDELGKHILQDGRDTVNWQTIKQRVTELFVGGILGASARGGLTAAGKVAQASQAPIAAAEAVAETQVEPQLGQQSAGAVGPTQVEPEPQATKTKASFKIPPRADGEWDVIDYVNELGGIRPPIDRSGGEYDGYAETMGQGVLRMLRNKGGRPVDTLIGELNDSFGTKFESPDELWRALAKAAEDRPKVAARMDKLEHEGKLYAALMENKGRTLAQAATDAVPLSSLRVGESIQVKGERLEVVELLPDQGEIVLQGEDRLVLPLAESVYVDNNFVDAAPYEPVDPDDPFAMGPSPQEYIADAVEHRKSFAASVLKAAQMPMPKGYALEGERVTPRVKSRAQQDELDQARSSIAEEGYEQPQGEAYNTKQGPLGDAPTVEAPVAPKDDPNYSELPIEMPEMVQMYRDLLGGKYPKVVEKIRALKGRALGVFRHTDGRGGQGEIEMRTDLFQLVSDEEKAEMRKRSMAQALAQLNKDQVDVEVQQLAEQLYEEQLREATAAAKRKPPVLASKVLAHEIMHLVDWLPQKMIKGRGNILGRIKSAKKFLKSQLNPWEIGPQQTLTDQDRQRLRRLAKGLAAEDLAAAELSPDAVKTDISPEEILNVWNNTNARDMDPDLHDYVARLTPEQKKELVRAAMRENLPKWFTFLRKLENDPAKVTKSEREYYRELLKAEINKRQVFWIEELKAEAEGAIAWWHGMKTMPDYFKTSIEMYAEMGNILLNNPAALRERAPKYYDAFMRYRANKPEFSRLYDQIQELMLTGNVQDKRMRDVEEMLQRQAEWAHESDMSKMAFKQSFNRVQGALFREQSRVLSYLDKGSPEIARAKMMMGDYRYRDSGVELMLRRVNERVFKPIKQAGLSLNDLALYSLHQHVFNNRADIANTLGLNPKASAEQLDHLRKRMSDEQWQALEAARREWSAVRRENVISPLMKAGVLSPETTEILLERDQYVTFSRGLDAKPNRRAESIRDLIESNFGSHEAGRIYRQNGWLGEIKDPVTATLQKDMALIRMAKREQAKKAVVQGMLDQGSDFIEEASYTFDGKRRKPRVISGDRVGTLQYQDAGETKAYYVPREVADFFDSAQSMNDWVFGLFTIPNNISKALFTQNNPGFVPVAFLRDIGAAIMQLPDARARKILPLIPGSMADAARGFLGGAAPYTEQALERGVIISRATPKGEKMGMVPGSEALMLRFGINPHAGKGEAMPLVEKIGKAWNTIFIPGQIAERTMKIAGMRFLDQKHPTMPEGRKAEMIREWAGSPDFLNRGSSNPIMETMVGLYYNAAREGIRSFGKKVATNPWSVGVSFLTYVAGPAGVMMLAEMGLAGDEAEEQMKSVPEYDKTNYIIVPIGWEDKAQQKVKYLRLPLFEGHKWMHGAARKLMQVAIEESTTPLKELKEFAGDQFPTENPFLQVLGGLYNFYVSGLNPQDSFTNSPVVTQDAMLTGDDDDTQVWKWVWNKLGGGLIHRFDRKSLNQTTTTELERRLKAPGVQNTLGRFLKVSNRGRIEKAREIGEPLLVDAAKDRQAIEKMLLQMYDQGRSDLTDKQWQWIQQKPYRMQHLKHKWKRADKMRKSFEYRLLQAVPSKAARQAVKDQLLNQAEY